MANQGDIKGRAFGAGTISPFGNTSILPLSIQNTRRSREATERLDETFPMKRHWTGTKSLFGNGFMRCRMSTY